MKLNRYFSSLCVGLAIVGLTSCSDFLTEYPTNNENVPNYYKTETDIAQGVNAAYAALASRAQYGASYIYMMELRSDISSVGSLTNSGGIYGDVYLFRESPYNSVLNDTWVGCYETVKRCNVVLDRIDGVAMDDSKRNQYQGEMLFIRALTHFNLVRLWGDVPLATHYYDAPFDALKEGRTPKAEVYRQIEADLRDAIAKLPAAKDKKRPGAAVANTAKVLLAKVYLTQGNNAAAETLLKEVIDSKMYKFIDDYATLFNVTNKNNSESVFEIQYSGAETGLGSSFANIFAPAGSRELTNGVGTTDGINLPTKEFVASYDDGDKRKDVTIGTTSNGTAYCKKFVAAPVLANQSDANFIVLRYTDVLLMYAEVLNAKSYSATGDAMTYLNQVRTRAGLPVYTAAELPTKEAFAAALLDERKFEFAFENQRWFDMLRSGRAVELTNKSGRPNPIAEYQLVYPIPQKQIDVAPAYMTQNQGY